MVVTESLIGYDASLRGLSHEASGLPCQDNSGTFLSDTYSICAVSDGHGSAPHFRSDIGSRIAIDAAIQVIRAYVDQSNFEEHLLSNSDVLLSKISKSIIAQWVKGVETYDAEHPITEKESEIISRNNLDIGDIYRRYGATLLAGFISHKYSFGLQIGDGGLVALNKELEPFEPIPKDELCVFNQTTSICSSDALEYFHWFVDTTGQVAAITVATDGFTSSFVSDESYLRQCSNIALYLNNGGAWGDVVANLEKRSKSNTMDDVSLAIVIIQTEKPIKSPQVMKQPLSFKSSNQAYRKKKIKQKRKKGRH